MCRLGPLVRTHQYPSRVDVTPQDTDDGNGLRFSSGSRVPVVHSRGVCGPAQRANGGPGVEQLDRGSSSPPWTRTSVKVPHLSSYPPRRCPLALARRTCTCEIIVIVMDQGCLNRHAVSWGFGCAAKPLLPTFRHAPLSHRPQRSRDHLFNLFPSYWMSQSRLAQRTDFVLTGPCQGRRRADCE